MFRWRHQEFPAQKWGKESNEAEVNSHATKSKWKKLKEAGDRFGRTSLQQNPKFEHGNGCGPQCDQMFE